MKALLLTPYIQPHLGLAMFRLPRNAHEFMHQRMVLLPEPAELANKQSGMVDWQGAGDNALSPFVLDFLNNSEVRSKLAKQETLKTYVATIKHCQLSDGEYCHKELTLTAHLNGYLRTCWHHDTEMRKGNYDTDKVKAVVEQNIQQCMIAQIQQDLQHSRPLSEADIVLYCLKNHMRKYLSDGLLRHFFKLKPFVRDNKESSTRFDDPLDYHVAQLSKAVLELKVDEDPPLQYMARPKAQFIRSEKWLRWVKSQPCVCCGKQADDPHHLIGMGHGIMGGKDNDTATIPLCRFHHNELHRNTAEFEQKYGTQAQLWYEFFTHSIKIGAIEIA